MLYRDIFPVMHSVASLGGGRGADPPGDNLQGVTPEGKIFCGQIYKE